MSCLELIKKALEIKKKHVGVTLCNSVHWCCEYICSAFGPQQEGKGLDPARVTHNQVVCTHPMPPRRATPFASLANATRDSRIKPDTRAC